MRRSILKKPGEGMEGHEKGRSGSKMTVSFERLTTKPSAGKLFVLICVFGAASFILFSLYNNGFLSLDEYFITGFSEVGEKESQENEQHGDAKQTVFKETAGGNPNGLSEAVDKLGTRAEGINQDSSTKRKVNLNDKEKKDDKEQETITEKEIQQDHEHYNVLFQLVNAEAESKFSRNFYSCVKSILTRTNLTLSFHITVDDISKKTAENIFDELKNELHLKKAPIRNYYIVEEINKKIYPYTKTLQELFSSGPNTYYSHAIFFISTAMHKILPKSIKRLVMMDTDLQLRTDIKNLFEIFAEMPTTSVMALAREQQPVYRHVLWSYRNSHPGTKVGEPPPHGQTGFNSGVKLMDLDRMRKSDEYNAILEGTNATKLAQKYSLKGHLGDQDFFSLVSFEHPGLFHTLPCQWNRQLCTWWRDNGYQDVFDLYFKCDPPYYVLHGNCDTPIPG